MTRSLNKQRFALAGLGTATPGGAARLMGLAMLASLTSTAALAQQSGTLAWRIGATRITPQVSSGDLTTPSFPGTHVDVQANTQPTGGLTWTQDAHLAFDLPIAPGFKHDIVGDGAIAGVGKIGETKVLPITVLAQYRLGEPGSALRPYLGAGPTFARFYKERSTLVLSGLTGGSASDPTTLRIDNRWGVSFQAGLGWALGNGWTLDAAVVKTLLRTRATLSTGQTIDVELNPLTVSMGVGRSF